MAGHQSTEVLRERMGPTRVAKAKAQAKEIQAEMPLTELRKLEGLTQAERVLQVGERRKRSDKI